MKKIINELHLSFKALSINESFARSCVASFCVQAKASVDEITDIKTAVSEAVTNCVVHAYPNTDGVVNIDVILYKDSVEITISDSGVGIKNIPEALEPFYTSKPFEERSGMGFTIMESFMDEMQVLPNPTGGVKVRLVKSFLGNNKKLIVGE